MVIVGDFAIKYSKYAEQLDVNLDGLYQALVDTAEKTVRQCICRYLQKTN